MLRRYPEVAAWGRGWMNMKRRSLILLPTCLAFTGIASFARAAAPDEAPDAVIRQIADDVMATAQADRALQAGDLRATMALVDSKIMPRVDFRRMTAAAVGPAWRQATAEQRARLQQEFKLLLVRTYAGALAQLNGRTISVQPVRAAAGDPDVLVRSQVRGGGDPLELAYRLERNADGEWRIYNLNVLGIWLVDTYRGQFAPDINATGIDGLIAALARRNAENRTVR